MITTSLAFFVLVVGLDVAGLLFDLTLYLYGAPTVSQCVWRWPWLGAPVVAWQLAGAAALGLHFWGR